MQNPITKFLTDNAITMILVLIGFVVGYSTLMADLRAVQARADMNEQKIENLSLLVERIIVLEERDRSYDQDFVEIKTDLKEIKSQINRLN